MFAPMNRRKLMTSALMTVPTILGGKKLMEWFGSLSVPTMDFNSVWNTGQVREINWKMIDDELIGFFPRVVRDMDKDDQRGVGTDYSFYRSLNEYVSAHNVEIEYSGQIFKYGKHYLRHTKDSLEFCKGIPDERIERLDLRVSFTPEMHAMVSDAGQKEMGRFIIRHLGDRLIKMKDELYRDGKIKYWGYKIVDRGFEGRMMVGDIPVGMPIKQYGMELWIER